MQEFHMEAIRFAVGSRYDIGRFDVCLLRPLE